MKILKKIIVAFLTLILINLIVILTFSFNLKETIINGIIKNQVKEEITSIKYDTEITDNEQVNEILESKEIQELINKYLDITMNGLIDDDSISDVNIEKDIIEYLKENKSTLEELTGVEITDEMIENAQNEIEEKDINTAYKQSIRNTSNSLTETEKNIIKIYNYIISSQFKILISILILVDILLIMLTELSLYKWIKSLGHALFFSGISIIAISLISKLIINNIYSTINYQVTTLVISGISLFVIGIIIIILYKLITKIHIKKKEDVHEISQSLNN